MTDDSVVADERDLLAFSQLCSAAVFAGFELFWS
jgi:hypothetical protein